MMIWGEEEIVETEEESIKLQQVHSFKYLGAQIQNNGKQETEINERISTAILHAEQKLFKDESNYKKDQSKCV